MKDEATVAAGSREGLLHFPAVETHLVRSTYVQQDFKIQVMQPGRSIGETPTYPVVYATDGNWVFDMFKSISYLLQMSERDAPPFILIGIGYPSESPHAGMRLRGRDFTYPPYPMLDMNALPLRYEGILLPEEGAKDFYGAEDFRRFIGEELIPFIDERYQTTPENRTYFGHSGGGYFGLFSLFTQPHLFRNYIISSPGLIYDGEAPGGIQYENYDGGLQMARDFIASGESLVGIKLYMSVGAEEEFESEHTGGWQLTSGFYRMAKLLKQSAIPGMELMTEVFAGESHMTAWPVAFIHGVQAVFGTRRVVSAVY